MKALGARRSGWGRGLGRRVGKGPRVCFKCADLAQVLDETAGELTPYRELDVALTRLARALKDVLGEELVGVYTLGSLAIGGFDLTSDVDLVAVTAGELTGDQPAWVESSHRELISGESRWVKHLEYSLFPLSALHELSSPYDSRGERNRSESRLLWKFDNGQPDLARTDHDNTLVTRWTLRYKARVICGPEPETFAPAISAEALRREIQQSMLGWEQRAVTDPSEFDNRFHQVFMVLNNCRALQDLHEGRITSKREGVAWAKRHLEPRWHALIDYSWQERQDPGIHVSQPADPDAFAETLAFIGYTTRLAEAADVVRTT